MILSAVVAMAENMVIGRDNSLPWHLPQDLRHFKTTTMGKPVVMGRKTYAAVGKILPGRLNIILTRNLNFSVPSPAVVIHEPGQVWQAVGNAAEVCIIGGSEIYQLFMPHIQRIYMTIVHANIEGDSYFPRISHEKWQQVSNEYYAADDKHAYAYSFICWERS